MDEDEMKAEKSDSAEVSVETSEVSKSDDAMVAITEIKDGLASAFSDLSAVIKSLNDEISALKKSVNLVSAKIEDAEKDFDNLGKRMDSVEADTAFRKSGDLGEIVQETQMEKSEKSLWGGRFLKTADLFR
jgi:chromosome segregation ATPase